MQTRLIAAFLAAAFLAAAFAASAQAAPIVLGGTVNTNVSANSSIYQIFGHSGSASPAYGPAADAVLLNFAAGANNLFHFSASGLTNCCSGAGNTQADGASGSTNVQGLNGLSSASGNSQLALLGVFTSEADPFGGSAPAALAWNANSPQSLSPLLNQVFYIGDGKSGFLNAAGNALDFLAPSGATRLYLGVADAWAFGGPSGYYNDNTGQYAVTIQLAAPAQGEVPEPGTLGLIGLGMAGLLGARRRTR